MARSARRPTRQPISPCTGRSRGSAASSTHSTYATAWAQAEQPIPCLGTTHADHFIGPVPVSRTLTDEEIGTDYELNTGLVIAERFTDPAMDPDETPACLAIRHGPFVWGPTVEMALENAIALEHVASIAIQSLAIAPNLAPLDPSLRDRHHRRKHGRTAYYGQPDEG
jgi:L-ribulose-5-phosphate 4-epimerase